MRYQRRSRLLVTLTLLPLMAVASRPAWAQPSAPPANDQVEELPLPPIIHRHGSPLPAYQVPGSLSTDPSTSVRLGLTDPFTGLQDYLRESRERDRRQLERLQQQLLRLEQALEAQRAARNLKEGAERPVSVPQQLQPRLGPLKIDPIVPPSLQSPATDLQLRAPGDDTADQPGILLDDEKTQDEAFRGGQTEQTDPPVSTPQDPRAVSVQGAVTIPASGSPLPLTDRAVDRAALADNLFGAGQTQLAQALYEELLSQEIEPAELLWYEYQLASSYRILGDLSQARRYYRRVASSPANDRLAATARWWLNNLDKQQHVVGQLEALRQTLQKIEQEL